MKNYNSILGIGLAVFSVAGLLYVRSTDMQSLVGLSPGAYPMFLLVLLLICGIMIATEGLRSNETKKMAINVKKVLPLLIAFIIYILVFQYLGFIISTILFLVAAMLLFNERRIKVIGSVSVIAPVVIYFLFTRLFMIPLP